MDEILIFGHRNPDTDSVTSAIALSYLKNQLGFHTSPRILGTPNRETKFALNYFDVPVPKYLNDVKSKVKHLNYQKSHLLENDLSILDCFNYMTENNIRTLPVIDENHKFQGLASMKDIAYFLITDDFRKLDASYPDIIDAIKGRTFLRYDDSIKGNVIVASYNSDRIIQNNIIQEDTILIVGDRKDILEHAIQIPCKLIILTGGAQLPPELHEQAQANKVNIITTEEDTYRTAKYINLSNNIRSLLIKDHVISVQNNMYVDEFVLITESSKYKNYPVVDENDNCLGIVSRMHVLEPNRKKVILVDHNEAKQSVEGLDEAEIIEIVDHHNIGSITTSQPINFRNMPLGSTNTILYKLYKEKGITIPKKIAGLMLSGIVSDTLLLKSPTTTDVDREAVKELAYVAGVDLETYAMQMFQEGTSLDGLSKDEIIHLDFKEFTVKDGKIGIDQVSTMNFMQIEKEKEEYIELLEKQTAANQYKLMAMFVTDIINECSYLYYNEGSSHILKLAFGLPEIYQGIKIDNCVSRKKQMVPRIIGVMDK